MGGEGHTAVCSGQTIAVPTIDHCIAEPFTWFGCQSTVAEVEACLKKIGSKLCRDGIPECANLTTCVQ